MALASLNAFAASLEWYASNLGGAEGASFFALHPRLKSINISLEHTNDPKHCPVGLRTPLPLLCKVNVPSTAHLSILRDSPVNEVELYVSQLDIPSDALAAINASAVPLERLTLRFLNHQNSLPWYNDLIAHLPTLQSLFVHEDRSNMGTQQVDVLARLSQLETLSLSWCAPLFTLPDMPDSIPPMVKRCMTLKRLEMRAMWGYSERFAWKYYRKSHTEAWSSDYPE